MLSCLPVTFMLYALASRSTWLTEDLIIKILDATVKPEA